jgi:hypothetical protein
MDSIVIFQIVTFDENVFMVLNPENKVEIGVATRGEANV